jgi:hypothetical protein
MCELAFTANDMLSLIILGGPWCVTTDRTEATFQQQFARFATDFVDPG